MWFIIPSYIFCFYKIYHIIPSSSMCQRGRGVLVVWMRHTLTHITMTFII